MASVLKVDKLDPQSGTALELGTSGDTISVPSGATLDISASTLTPPATMPASSAANLTSIPAANLTGTIAAISGANVTSLAAGNISTGTLAVARGGTGTTSYSPGITAASQWLITANFTYSSGGAVTANWAENYTTDGYSRLGSAMTESSGVFTFPSTGYWLVKGQLVLRLDSGSCQPYFVGQTSLNAGVDWNWAQFNAKLTHTGVGVNSYSTVTSDLIFDVTNTTNDLFQTYLGNSGDAPSVRGSTSGDDIATNIIFIRLGDT